MPSLPSASATLNESGGARAISTGYLVIMACVAQNADSVPRVMSSVADILAEHTYAQGVDYAAHHIKATRKPIIFVGLPITTAGAVYQIDQSGNTGTSLVSAAAASGGIMEETVTTVTARSTGTVGTDQIQFDLSCDGGVTKKRIMLGTGTSYTIPYLGIVLSFGVGTVKSGDILLTFKTSAPMWGSTALSTARTALAAQQNPARSWQVVGDLPNSTFAGYVSTETNAYETADDRYVYARAQVQDQQLAKKSKLLHAMAGGQALTFAAAGHTITRASGSWITDGFAIGDAVTVSGTVSNNYTKVISNLSATVMTFASGVVDETPTAGAPSVVGSESLTFDNVGQTITRGAGSWVSDGFAVGDSVTITGTASNNVTATITVLSATVMTFGSGLAAEGPILSSTVTIVKNQTLAAYVSAEAAAFATVDGQKRLDLGIGRAVAPVSSITGWSFRRPAQWPVCIREYQHDVQIATYEKDFGPLDGWSLTDANGNAQEFDERVNGGGLAGRFTCLRSYANGPLGAFVALSLTRDTEGALLSRTHNMAVADVAQTVVQKTTEDEIGRTLQLNDDGTGTEASLSKIEKRVNKQLQVNLLQNFKEGPRASKAVWSASRTDVLSAPDATLNGTLDLVINGTLEQIDTSIVVS